MTVCRRSMSRVQAFRRWLTGASITFQCLNVASTIFLLLEDHSEGNMICHVEL